jgi:hypothetical protein
VSFFQLRPSTSRVMVRKSKRPEAISPISATRCSRVRSGSFRMARTCSAVRSMIWLGRDPFGDSSA